MSWVKLDDGYADHPKVTPLSDRAFRLDVTAKCYASRHLTDGFLSQFWIASLKRSMQTAPAELVAAGLWERVENGSVSGWRIHDYLKYNPSREQVLKAREYERERKAGWRGRNVPDVVPPGLPPGFRAESHRSPSPSPSPSESLHEEEEVSCDPGAAPHVVAEPTSATSSGGLIRGVWIEAHTRAGRKPPYISTTDDLAAARIQDQLLARFQAPDVRDGFARIAETYITRSKAKTPTLAKLERDLEHWWAKTEGTV